MFAEMFEEMFADIAKILKTITLAEFLKITLDLIVGLGFAVIIALIAACI